MTSLKKMTTLSLTLVLSVLSFTVLASAPSQARAQVGFAAPILASDSMACEAYMLNKKGKWKYKMTAERQSERYLVWGQLIIRFEADVFAGGPGTVNGQLAIMTDTKPREILHHWVFDIGDKWKFQTEIETSEGPIRLKCHL